MYSLNVIPSDRKGKGKANYIFSKDNTILWLKEVASTLSEFRVSNKNNFEKIVHWPNELAEWHRTFTFLRNVTEKSVTYK